MENFTCFIVISCMISGAALIAAIGFYFMALFCHAAIQMWSEVTNAGRNVVDYLKNRREYMQWKQETRSYQAEEIDRRRYKDAFEQIKNKSGGRRHDD